MKADRALSLVLWLFMAGLALWAHFHLPDVPLATHYGLHGEVNGTQPRDQALILMPAITLGLMLLLWLAPAIMPKSASPDRFVPAYGAVVVAVVALMAGFEVMMILPALGVAVDQVRAIMIGLGLLFIVIGNFLPKMRLNYLMGIRTPWTLSDERVWERTHRFAGPLFVLGGLVTAAGAFVPGGVARFVILLAALGAPVVVSVIYSYLVSRRLNLS